MTSGLFAGGATPFLRGLSPGRPLGVGYRGPPPAGDAGRLVRRQVVRFGGGQGRETRQEVVPHDGAPERVELALELAPELPIYRFAWSRAQTDTRQLPQRHP